MLFNTNYHVKVRLNDLGRKVLRENHENLFRRFAEIGGRIDGGVPDYRPPEEDADGWSKWQLWDLMRQFGRCMGNGFPVPFETTIEIIEPFG